MPDQDGKLTDEEKTKVLAWLNKHEKTPRVCQLCGSTNWTLAEHFVQPIRFGAGGAIQVGGPAYPQIMLISNPCGHTLYVNAVQIGLFPPGSSPQ